MFSYVLGSASTYFHLPIEEDEDFLEEDYIPPTTKHISWVPSDATLSPDTTSFATASPSSPAGPSKQRKPPSEQSTSKNRATINEILSQDDCYAVLGISRASRIDKLTLRRAYLARSKACHPDKFPDNPEATRAFQKVSVAYDILSKPSSKRMYDSRSTKTPFDFTSTTYPRAEETFRGVIIGVINDMLDGDLEMVRTILFAVNNMNPSLQLGEEGINSVLMTLEAIRTRALSCRTCIFALHHEVTRVLEVQRAFRQLSYFDLRRRSYLMIQLARLTISMPIALEEALRQQKEEDYGESAVRDSETTLLNRRVYTLLRGIVSVLERMEGLVKK